MRSTLRDVHCSAVTASTQLENTAGRQIVQRCVIPSGRWRLEYRAVALRPAAYAAGFRGLRVVNGEGRCAAHTRAAHDHLEPQRVQAADAFRERERVPDGRERDWPAVDADVEPMREAPGVVLSVDALLLRLERRDLRQVEDVADVEPVARDLDAREAVDREVAERVRLRGDRRKERQRKRGKENELLHRRLPLSATGDQSTEKRGLSASALRYQVAASARLPRQAAIQPRWKNLSASFVPSRSDRFAYVRASPHLPLRASTQPSTSSPKMLGRST